MTSKESRLLSNLLDNLIRIEGLEDLGPSVKVDLLERLLGAGGFLITGRKIWFR